MSGTAGWDKQPASRIIKCDNRGLGRTNSNLVETQSVADHPQYIRQRGHPRDRQRKKNYQLKNIIHGLPP